MFPGKYYNIRFNLKTTFLCMCEKKIVTYLIMITEVFTYVHRVECNILIASKSSHKLFLNSHLTDVAKKML